MDWCDYTWTVDGVTYRCSQLKDHKPRNVHTSEGGQLHVESAPTS
ncbi:hypothetical protein SEA_PABST_15 [Microbacterium phage Pabst]|nr:hypothetical protein SEA_PABST_15 [Microbacterium phage Pabst]